MKHIKCLVLIAMLAFSAACSNGNSNNGGGGGGEGDGCSMLCTDSGFSSGTETDFGGGLIECQCEGSGVGILQEDCNAYCAEFGVPPEDSLLSTTNVANDKCVCDGTSL